MDDVEAPLHSGHLYSLENDEIGQIQMERCELAWEYNQLRPTEKDRRHALLKEMCAEVGDGCHVEPPFHANWGGAHLHLGSRVYANFNLTLVDDTHIYIGDDTMIGPNVTITTAGHPLDPTLRTAQLQYNLPVRIGERVWIGAGCTILPGVSIGDEAVIGAGAVVTRDIPAGVLALGVPCRVIREIGEHEREFYYRELRIPEELHQRFRF